MFLDLALIAGGLAILAWAGDQLVNFASAAAEKARVTKAVIGLTVVAAGTSMPELFVSAAAALKGTPDIALGNVIGSNIFNIALILGLCATIAAVEVHGQTIKLDFPFCLLASFIALLLLRDGLLDRLESGFFLVSMLAFVVYSIRLARQEISAQERQDIADLAVPGEATPLKLKPGWFLAGGLLLSFAGLTVGAKLLLEGAVGIARAAGMTERVIGLTIVAAGTSLPEVVASVTATVRKHYDIAVTNIIGSNIFNILFILGVSGLITPIPVSPQIVAIDAWVMVAVTVAFFPLVYWTRKITRPGGIGLLLAFGSYMTWLVVNP